ncbi:MAG: VOC family protein [Candidatus Hodarchaeales archaeon]|jgi:predicted enzyme related to lactoylglutathione lyase
MEDVGIEIPVLDLEKGIEFYETVFGWTFDRERMPKQGWANINGSIGISIFQTEKIRPKGLNIGFKVDNIDETLKKVTSKDGKIIKEKFYYENYGSVAVIQDCFGTELSLTSPSA